MDKNARIRIGIATLLIAALVTTLALHFTAAQAGPSVSSGYTIDRDSVYWEVGNKGRITVSPHTSHGSWDAMRYQNIEFESYLGTDEEITCGLAFNVRPVDYGLSLQKEHVVQYPLYDPETNETLGYDDVTESYWQDVTSQLTTGNKDDKFFGYGTFTVPANGKKTFQVRYLLDESDPVDENGKKKWEMRCWQGSFADPTWEINLDPWADNLTCAAYYTFDNNETGATSTKNWFNCTAGNATLYGATTGHTGAVGEAFYMDRTANWYAASDNTVGISGGADRTMGGWFNITEDQDNMQIMGFGLDDGVTQSTYFSISMYDGGIGGWCFDTKGWNCFKAGDAVLTNGASWQFLAVSLNESGTRINLYHNGTFMKNCSGVGPMATTDSPLHLGNKTRSSFYSYTGEMDEVFLFATALTDEQIMAMYVNGTRSLWSSPGTSSANESAGRSAIVAGISASTASSGTTYTDQQMYIYYLNGTQKLGTFDKVLSEGNQRWLFNYNTTGENYTGMESISPAIYVWENTSLTASEITAQVSGFINSTDT